MANQIFRSGFNLGLPEAERLDREIRALQQRRDQIISDHLAGRERIEVGGVDFVTDPTVESDTLELRDGAGRCVGKIINIGV